MQPTRNDIPEGLRTKMTALLAKRLADSLDLYGHVKHAHWNVKGQNFIALHELFDAVATNAATFADDIAERSVQLGGLANGLAAEVARTTSLAAFTPSYTTERGWVEAVANTLAACAKNIRASIDEAAAAGDADTADLFTTISRTIDKDVWFVDSHLRG